MDDDLRFSVGGNNPPPYETAKLEAEQALIEFTDRLQEFLVALGKIDIKNRGDAQLATDRLGLARDFAKLIENKREEVITPYRQAVNAINSVFQNFTEDLNAAGRAGVAKIQAYQDHVKAMALKQQEEQRAAALEAQKQLSGNSGQVEQPATTGMTDHLPIEPPKPKPIRGDLGKKVVNRATKRAVLVDLKQVPSFIMESQQVKSAIEAVATSMLKQFPNPPGFEIKTNESVNVQ